MQRAMDILARENVKLREEVIQYRAERDWARDLAIHIDDSDEYDVLGSDYACWCNWAEFNPGLLNDIPCVHDPELAKLYEGQPSLDDLLREAAEDATPG